MNSPGTGCSLCQSLRHTGSEANGTLTSQTQSVTGFNANSVDLRLISSHFDFIESLHRSIDGIQLELGFEVPSYQMMEIMRGHFQSNRKRQWNLATLSDRSVKSFNLNLRLKCYRVANVIFALSIETVGLIIASLSDDFPCACGRQSNGNTAEVSADSSARHLDVSEFPSFFRIICISCFCFLFLCFWKYLIIFWLQRQ